MLTQIELKRIFNYDPKTGLFTRLVATNNSVKVGDVANSHSHGYIAIQIVGKNYRVHRLAWLYMTGDFPKQEIDHINGVRNDNRWNNLRDVTPSVNKQNQRKPRIDNTSGYAGVGWRKDIGKWYVQIRVNKKKIHLGLFTDKEKAAAHYLQKKRELHEGCTL